MPRQVLRKLLSYEREVQNMQNRPVTAQKFCTNGMYVVSAAIAKAIALVIDVIVIDGPICASAAAADLCCALADLLQSTPRSCSTTQWLSLSACYLSCVSYPNQACMIKNASSTPIATTNIGVIVMMKFARPPHSENNARALTVAWRKLCMNCKNVSNI